MADAGALVLVKSEKCKQKNIADAGALVKKEKREQTKKKKPSKDLPCRSQETMQQYEKNRKTVRVRLSQVEMEAIDNYQCVLGEKEFREQQLHELKEKYENLLVSKQRLEQEVEDLRARVSRHEDQRKQVYHILKKLRGEVVAEHFDKHGNLL